MHRSALLRKGYLLGACGRQYCLIQHSFCCGGNSIDSEYSNRSSPHHIKEKEWLILHTRARNWCENTGNR